ncbi:MAG: hypothetical protein JWO98_5510 [Frankiales bacterium]|nr:hypothetical protein [Frankiales bacterium]
MRVLIKTLLCLCIVLMLASCTSVVTHTSVSTPTAARTIAPPPTPAPPVIKQVAHKWESGTFQNGIQLYWHFPGTDADVIAKADSTLDYIVSLGANSVAISFPIYTDGIRPTRVYANKDTPSPAQLGLVLAAAKARGLRITVRPIINEANIVAQDPNGWRGNIKPRSVTGWFASYDQFMQQYALVMQQYGVQEFVAGTELVSLRGYTAEWKQLIQRLAGVYVGTISYAANWDEGQNPAFQTQGVDAYPAINLPDSASVDRLTAALTGWIEKTPPDVRARLTLQEVGIPAHSGVYIHPWYWGTNKAPLNFTVQANWYTAMCRAAHAASVNGIYYWTVDTNVDLKNVNPYTEYSGGFVNRPAQQSIESCFFVPSEHPIPGHVPPQ